jgi:hypothetical protein
MLSSWAAAGVTTSDETDVGTSACGEVQVFDAFASLPTPGRLARQVCR